MVTASAEQLRSRQERLNATLRQAVETIRQAFLDAASLTESRREVEQELEKVLRVGMEREALLLILGEIRSGAEHDVALFAKAHALFADDSTLAAPIEAQLRGASNFLGRVRELEARVSAPAPPFDPSKLPAPAPTGPTAEGYISVSEARQRMRAGKKP